VRRAAIRETNARRQQAEVDREAQKGQDRAERPQRVHRPWEACAAAQGPPCAHAGPCASRRPGPAAGGPGLRLSAAASWLPAETGKIFSPSAGSRKSADGVAPRLLNSPAFIRSSTSGRSRAMRAVRYSGSVPLDKRVMLSLVLWPIELTLLTLFLPFPISPCSVIASPVRLHDDMPAARAEAGVCLDVLTQWTGHALGMPGQIVALYAPHRARGVAYPGHTVAVATLAWTSAAGAH